MAEQKQPTTAKKTRAAEAVQAVAPKKTATVKNDSTVTIDVVDTNGKVTDKVSVPAAIFAAPVNQTLMAQAIRVYQTNQHQGTAHAKTRGEVNATTKKVYRQKGTGNARHGSKSAPTYVGGGKAHGPQPYATRLVMPKKMRRQALFSALTLQLQNNNIMVVSDFQKVEPKTKQMVSVLSSIFTTDAKKPAKTLVVVPGKDDVVGRTTRNIPYISLSQSADLHTYAVLNAKKVLFTKDAVSKLTEVFLTKTSKPVKTEGQAA